MPERRTNETGFGLWRTPTVSSAERGAMLGSVRIARGQTMSLQDQVKDPLTWPTPMATDGSHGGLVTPQKARLGGSLTEALSASIWPTPTVNGNYNKKGISEKSGDGLATAVKSWPTPMASYGKPRGTNASTSRRVRLGKQISLEATVKLYPTPTAHNAKEGAFPAEYTRKTPTLATHAGGQLNPTWVEWLMGWPLGWTDCAVSATAKFQQWPRSHGMFSAKESSDG